MLILVLGKGKGFAKKVSESPSSAIALPVPSISDWTRVSTLIAGTKSMSTFGEYGSFSS